MCVIHIIHQDHDVMDDVHKSFEKDDLHVHRHATLVEFVARWDRTIPSIILLGDHLVDGSWCDVFDYVKKNKTEFVKFVALLPEPSTGRSLNPAQKLPDEVSTHIFYPIKRRTAVMIVRQMIQESRGLLPGQARATARLGSYTVDLGDGTIHSEDGNIIKMTPREYQVILAFVDYPSEIIRREKIRDRIEADQPLALRAIDNLVCRIRRKLPSKAQNHFIRTVSNIGYIYEPSWREE